MKIRERLAKIRADYLFFRDECVAAQIVAVKRISIMAMLVSIAAPFILLAFVTDSAEYVITQYIALTIVAASCLLMVFMIDHLKFFQNSLRHRTNFGECVYFISCFLYIAWGNLSLGITYRVIERFDIVVWIVIYLIVAGMATMMPFQVIMVNLASFATTIIQIYRLSGKAPDRFIVYHVSMFVFFISFIMIEKYQYSLKSFKRLKSIEEQRADRESFLVNMTHEMRTPLNAVLGKNNIIINDTKEQETLKLSKEINTSGKIILAMINDILDLSKMEAGKMTINPVNYSPSVISYEVADIMRSDAVAKGLGFKLEVSSNVPAGLYGDDVRIRQVIMNLVSNAIKYTREGSVTLRMWFDNIDPNDKIGQLHVAVIDTGIGIKEEDLPKLKKAFMRLDSENNRNVEGTGLGLAISSSLLQLMGSELKVDSVYEIGSTFSFTVEQMVTDARSLRKFYKETDDSGIKRFDASLAKVLVVDDNKVNFSVCKGLMKYYGFVPDYAESGEKALKMIKTGDYDLIFIDHLMPEMSGLEVLNHIKEEYPEMYGKTPIVALTANENQNSEEEYKGLGFTDYLGKPIDEQKLHDILDKYIPEEKRVKAPKA
ncbi:Signal transduction histidine kinase [Lachnospiraceae bacterium YSD2013]|nr:Signal transduction histidine kinase [Lachnospiraceae bacterium YSD2013]